MILEFHSLDSFLAFATNKNDLDNNEPTLTNNEWLEINSPFKNVSFLCH